MQGGRLAGGFKLRDLRTVLEPCATGGAAGARGLVWDTCSHENMCSHRRAQGSEWGQEEAEAPEPVHSHSCGCWCT